jgi:hypothetical protein
VSFPRKTSRRFSIGSVYFVAHPRFGPATGTSSQATEMTKSSQDQQSASQNTHTSPRPRSYWGANTGRFPAPMAPTVRLPTTRKWTTIPEASKDWLRAAVRQKSSGGKTRVGFQIGDTLRTEVDCGGSAFVDGTCRTDNGCLCVGICTYQGPSFSRSLNAASALGNMLRGEPTGWPTVVLRIDSSRFGGCSISANLSA